VITRFVVDPTALGCADIDAHERLLDLWRLYGCLLCDVSEGSRSELLRAVAQLKLPARKLWQTVLERGRIGQCAGATAQLAEVIEPIDLAGIGITACLAILADDRAELLGIDSSQRWMQLNGVEVTRFGSADRAPVWRSSKDVWDSMVKLGDRTDDVWKSKFLPLASNPSTAKVQHVTVTDRYAWTNLEKHKDSSGLFRLLKGLDGVPGVKHAVKVYSMCDCIDSHTSELVRAFDAFRRGGLVSVRVVLAPDNFFAKKAHYRYVRFADHVLQLDTGLNVLQADVVKADSPVRLRLKQAEDKELERFLDDCGTSLAGWPDK
jgi:hypothetical protein